MHWHTSALGQSPATEGQLVAPGGLRMDAGTAEIDTLIDMGNSRFSLVMLIHKTNPGSVTGRLVERDLVH